MSYHIQLPKIALFSILFLISLPVKTGYVAMCEKTAPFYFLVADCNSSLISASQCMQVAEKLYLFYYMPLNYTIT